MKNKVIGGLLLTAAIGTQVSALAADKVGNLTFALTDNRQQTVSVNGNTSIAAAAGSVTALLDAEPWDNEFCDAVVKYESKSTKVDTKYVISAIGKAMGITFDSKAAQLLVDNYDNEVPAPPYPPYINPAGFGDDMLNVFNGPRDTTGTLFADYVWPNELQIDWVNYSLVYPATDVDPKASVYVVENKADGRCIDVSPFFSIEEAYCYHCWDTVGRVTKGTMSTKSPDSGDPCVGGGGAGCGLAGNGTTQYYLTVKFNNILAENLYLDTFNFGTDYNNYLIDVVGLADADEDGQVIRQVGLADELQFTVAGVVSYKWKIQPIDGIAAAMGTHTMGKAEGYGDLGNRCGVFTGSVKITETSKVAVPCRGDIIIPD